MENTLKSRVNKILLENKLDFTIHKTPMFVTHNETKLPTDYFGLVNSKTNEVLNAVKGSYTVSQNDEIVETVLRGAEPFGNLSVNKAVSINGGRRVLIQLKLEGVAKIGGRNDLERYITIIDSNDGSTGLSVGIGTNTLSCQNQFFAFYKAGQFKSKHTNSIIAKIKEMPSLIELALSELYRKTEVFNKFQSTQVSRNLANELVNNLLGFDRTASEKELAELSTRNVNAMQELYNNIDIETNCKGQNLWGLFSGVTRWTTHTKSAPLRDNGRIESLSMGTNYKTNEKALNWCLEHV